MPNRRALCHRRLLAAASRPGWLQSACRTRNQKFLPCRARSALWVVVDARKRRIPGCRPWINLCCSRRECAMPRSGTIEAAQPWGTSRVRQPASLEWPRLSTLAASTSFLPASRLTLPSVNTSGCRLRRGPTKAALPRARPRTSRAQLSPFDTKWRRSRRRTPGLVRKPALPLRPDPTGSRRTPGRRSLTLPRARQRLSPLPQSNAPPPATSVAPGT
jgi:hypothetical protein